MAKKEKKVNRPIDEKYLVVAPGGNLKKVQMGTSRKDVLQFAPIAFFDEASAHPIDNPVFRKMLELNYKHRDKVGFAIVTQAQKAMLTKAIGVEVIGSLGHVRKEMGDIFVQETTPEEVIPDESL